MKDSNHLFIFLFSGFIVLGLVVSDAYATEALHYFEENTICATTTSTSTILNVTDGVDFDFIIDNDYLIVTSSTWGGGSNAEVYEIKLQHNATVFEGSQQIVEPKAKNIDCSADKDYYRYMYWTVWSPSTATEASQDIILNYTSLEGSNMQSDDSTIFIMNLGGSLQEGSNWFFNENATDEPLSFNELEAPEATFLGSAIDGEFIEQPAKFFKDNTNEDDDGFVDCIRVFDVALNSTTANFITNSTDTCFPFPDVSIPVPIRIYDLNGNATDLKGGSDLVLSDGGTGLNATGWNFLAVDDAQIVPSDIPNTEYAIEMVLSFEGFTSDPSTFVFPRILDFHNNEGAFNGQGVEYGLHGDEEGQTADVGLWFWDVQGLGVGFGGTPMTNNTLSHILIQRNSTGYVEAYKDGSLAFAYNDNGIQFNTDSSAVLNFTPMFDDHDWLILGSSLLAVQDLANQYETRLNFNNETFTPLASREGEDVEEQIVQTFGRVFTLNNTQVHNFELESRNAFEPVGINERLHNALFALNLNRLEFHNSTYIEAPLNIDNSQGVFGFNVATTEVTANQTANWFIMGGFEKDGDKKMNIRMQVEDDTGTLEDEPEGQTTQAYEFSDAWDQLDRIPNYYSTLQNLNNNTHTANIDASLTGAGNKDARDRSLFGFTMDFAQFNFNATGDDPMSMTDNIRLDFSKNFTDPFSWTDDIRIDLSKNFTDPMSWTDFINVTTTITLDDPMSMLDDIRIDLSKNFTDPFSWIDFVNVTIGKPFDDPISMLDDITFDISDSKDDPMSMLDDIRIDIVDSKEDPMSWIDLLNVTIGKPFDDSMSWTDFINVTSTISPEDPMSILDDIRIDISDSKDDSMSMPDDITIDIVDVKDEDAISWTDTINIFISFGSPPIVIPPTNVTVTGGAGAGAGVSSPTIPDSDGDGFLDNEDQCPNEPETFNNFQDLDGCPDFFGEPEPLTIADLGFPFDFNELSIVDDFINLETDSPQPQVEDLGIRWLGDEPITITKIDVGSSPFEIQYQDLPISFGNNQFGFTQEQIIYTVQEPDKICTTTFSFDCVDDVTYEIPVVITGEVRGKTVIAEGSITIDNSNRFNPYWYILFVLILIPFFAFFLWHKRRNARPTTKEELNLTQAKQTTKLKVTTGQSKPLKAGTTRRTLTETKKTNVLGKKTK